MILDVSPEGRARMRRAAREDLAQWCEKEGIPPEVVLIEFVGRDVERGFETKERTEGAVRRRRRYVQEYPPRSTWWYMTGGDGQ